MNLQKAIRLMDQVVSSSLDMMNADMNNSLLELESIFSSFSTQLVDHLKDHWYSKKGDIAQFYLNLDGKSKRALLESFGVEVEDEKISDIGEQMQAKINGLSDWEIYPFESQMVHQFYLTCNNNSLELVKKMENGELLKKHLEASQIDKYGNGRNWSEFYEYLRLSNILEREEIIKYAHSH